MNAWRSPEYSSCGPSSDWLARSARRLEGRQTTCVHRFGDERAGDAQVERQLAHPFARPLSPGAVENLVDQLSCAVAVGAVVVDAENVARDFNQIAVEIAAIPLVEHVVEF